MPETFTARFQLREVVENGTLMIAQLLISQGPGGKHSPLDTVPSIFDSTLLREAVQNGRLDTVQSLPTHGADINTP